MKLFSKGVCRGFGAAYLPFLTNTDEPVNLDVETERGKPVPFSNHFDRQYGVSVVTLPLLRCDKLKVYSLDNPRIVVSNFKVKWLSRFNYKFHSAVVRQFRDIENDTYFGQIHVRCDVAG